MLKETLKADERILGDSEFVSEILHETDERFERRYRLKSKGYDFDKIVAIVGALLGFQMIYDP